MGSVWFRTGVFLLAAVVTVTGICPGGTHALESAPSPDRVIWYRADFPPVTIPLGEDAGTGFFDRVMSFLVERLPEYEHQYRTANFKRIISELQKGENACCPSLYKTEERDRFIAFSVPAMVVLPNGVITTEKKSEQLKPYVDANNKISLSALLNDQSLTLGISNGRLYSGGIDEILDRFRDRKNITVRSGDDVFKGLMSMLLLDRVDYIIGYPAEAGYFMKKAFKGDGYVYYPIAESRVPFTVGYIGCPKTEWRERFINRLNPILLQYRQTDDYLAFYDSWLDEYTGREFRKVARDFFSSDSER